MAGVVTAVKGAKLLPETEEPAAVLAKLPAVLQTAAVAIQSADGKKAAEALAAADKRAEAARADLAAAKAATAAAEATLLATRDELAAAKAKADERVTAAVAAAEAKATKELEAARGREAALNQQIAQTRQAADQTRGKLEAEFARQLADARGGVVVPLSTGELRDRDLATVELGRGMTAFFLNQTIDARLALDAATARNPNDARAWYFLGLTKWRGGDTYGADAAFRKGADLERKGLTARREVNDALVKVQGVERTVLAGYRP